MFLPCGRKPKAFQALLREVNEHFQYQTVETNQCVGIDFSCDQELPQVQGDCSDYAQLAYGRAHCHGIVVEIRLFTIPEGRHACVVYRDGRQWWVGDNWYKRPVRIERYRNGMRTRGL